MHDFESKLLNQWPLSQWADLSVLLAVSGGADSVALMRAVHSHRDACRGRILVAHYNHGLRDDESDGDERFISDLAQRLGLKCYIGRAPAKVPSELGFSESQLRKLRYDFLEKTALGSGARIVATAHTADDQAETILHRIIRGTGISGLRGIPKTRTVNAALTIVRPLLEFRRSEVIDYLRAIDQQYRMDSTNECLNYTRNRIRLRLLPEIERDFNPGARDAIIRLGGLAEQANQIVQAHVRALSARCVRIDNSRRLKIDCACVESESDYIVCELLMSVWRTQNWPLRPMGLDKWSSLCELMLGRSDAHVKRLTMPGNVLAERTESQLILTQSTPSSSSTT